MEKQLLLVVGAPRSGTTWLHHMLAAHPAVASLPNELTVFTYLALWDRQFQAEKTKLDEGRWQQGAPLLYEENEFYHGLRSLAEDIYARVLSRKPSATHLIDKHPNYARHLPLVQKLFPNAKVIHLIRDGREVVVSMMSAKKRLGFGKGEIHGASHHWAGNLVAARQAGHLLGPDQYLELRYEDLRSDTGTQLKTAFAFCNLPVTNATVQQIATEYDIRNKQVSRGNTHVNALRNTPDAIWKAKLSVQERWVLDRVAGHLLQELGYAKPGWWAVNPMDRLRMWPYPWTRRVLNTLGSAKHTWNQPLARPVLAAPSGTSRPHPIPPKISRRC